MNIFRSRFARVLAVIIVILGIAFTLLMIFRDNVENAFKDITNHAIAGALTDAGGTTLNGGTGLRSGTVVKGIADIAGMPGIIGDIDGAYYDTSIRPAPGLLTGGEWRDNDHWSDWCALYTSRDDWSDYQDEWRIFKENRIVVHVISDGVPVEGASVYCDNAVTAVTDNKGIAYVFYDPEDSLGKSLIVKSGDVTTECPFELDDATAVCDIAAEQHTDKILDLMIMCDSTGSMSDELAFLQSELADVIGRIKTDNGNIPVNISINFYRDNIDDYVVLDFPFTEDINIALENLNAQSAGGGGDYPEAVDTALNNAIVEHNWTETSTKIMFLVLDAPLHNDVQIVDRVNSLVEMAASQGIRIIPVAASGVDKSTEYLLRTIAFRTGGTYVFLTDDSGVGREHTEATVEAYNTGALNDLMVRIVNDYLASPAGIFTTDVQTAETTISDYIQ